MKNLQTMKQSVQKGFTLIELMIVVAIIGILAAIAIPAYTDYTIKSRVSEGASLIGAPKTAMEVYWSENGTLMGPDGATRITLFDLDLVTSAAVTQLPGAEYVSAIFITGTAALPSLSVEYKDSTALGTASETCVEYFPDADANENIEWEVRAAAAYTTPGGKDVAIGNCGTEIVNKYKPKS